MGGFSNINQGRSIAYSELATGARLCIILISVLKVSVKINVKSKRIVLSVGAMDESEECEGEGGGEDEGNGE